VIDSPIEEIKQRLDVVDLVRNYVNLVKAGNNYKACCPFHQEKTPSFFVSPDKQMFKCFGCGEGGDIFAFVQKIEGLEFRDALRLLADKAGVVLKKQDPKLQSERARLLEISHLATKFFEKQLSSKIGQAVTEYLLIDRGLKIETIKQFRLGYAPDDWRALSDFLMEQGYGVQEIVAAGLAIKKVGAASQINQNYYDRFRGRIMFPIADSQGNIIAFTGRILTDTIAEKFGLQIPKDMGKYINSPETLIYHKSRVLYGLDKAKNLIRQQRQAILVEGNMDVILCHQAGFNNAVAASGTALTIDQLNFLGRYTKNLVMAFDMDVAGQMATGRSIELALAHGFEIKIVDMAGQKDPADLIKIDLAVWQKSVAGAQKILDFYYAKTFADFKVTDVEQKKQAAANLLPWINRLNNSIEQAHWLQLVSQRLGISEETLRQEMRRISGLSQSPSSRYVASSSMQANNNEQPQPNNHIVQLGNSLLGLLILRPQYLSKLKDHRVFKEVLDHYLDNQAKEILVAIKGIKSDENENYLSLKDKIEPDIFRAMEKLAFEAECQYLSDETVDCQTEINFCLASLKKQHYKMSLTNLANQIKQAEIERDVHLMKKLLKSFQEVSANLAE